MGRNFPMYLEGTLFQWNLPSEKGGVF
jgi:hypothetical protein